MSDDKRSKGVFAKSSGEAADRGRKLGLEGTLKVEETSYLSSSGSDKDKTYTVSEVDD